MSREKKAQIIDELKEAFARSSVGILADYRGLNSPEMTDLRRRLKESESEFRVVKNTLARFAAEGVGMKGLAERFEGPIAIVFGYGDIVAPAKIITTYSGESKERFDVKGGFLGDRVLALDEIITLSKLPSRELLLSRVVGQMMGPVSALLGSLTSPMRGMIGLLQARIKQLEGE
jgi:large subunit ribosomal protein L10